jgi:PAS domain S-box-containing protein
MMTDADTEYLFLIGAYRDNEVNSAHPLMMTLETLRKAGATINFITLAPLALEPMTQLIADTLHSEIASVKLLAELVVRKTEGNPFFVNEFLKTLHAENLLTFNPPQSPNNKSFSLSSPLTKGGWRGKGGSKGGWQWDISNIEAKGITDNVVELMIGKVKKLPPSTQQVLRLAACVGASFDLNTLSIISEQSPHQISFELTPAVQSGLILPTSELDEKLLIQNYKFLHDRVQQAAYALIDEAQQQAVHLQIGRLLLQNTAPEALSEEIFEIADHLNFGVELVTQQQEREEIAKLNLLAGQKAKAAAAYGAAIKYFDVGRELLSADSWQKSYDLTLALYSEAAEAAYLNGDFIGMEQLALVVLNHAKTVLDKVKVYEVKILACMAQSEQLSAINTALAVLKAFEVEFPDVPRQLDIELGLEETTSNLVGKRIEDLIDLPTLKAPEKLVAMRILSKITSACYQAAPELFVLIVLKQVNLSIKYGNAPFSAYAYAAYGLILCGVVLDIESGYQFGELALSVLERFNSSELKAKTFFVAALFIRHWKEHVRETLKLFREGYQSGLENGDLEFASYCAGFTCQYSYFMGKELTALALEMETYGNAIEQIGQGQASAFYYHKIFQQVVLNLISSAENTTCLFGEAYNEDKLLPLHLEVNDRTGINYVFLSKLILCYLFGDFPQAVENAERTQEYLDGVTATIAVPLFHFYDSLARLAMYFDTPESERRSILDKVHANQEKMKTWAHHAPMNYLHKFELVEAERHRVLGENIEAMDYYDRAIALAKENEYLNEEALAYELAAKFYLKLGKQIIARTYMTEARYAYTRWGAKAKVEDLEARYSQLLPKSSATKSITSTLRKTTNSITGSYSASALDLASVMKASQAISGEIVLDKLLASLMKLLIENAGAQSGYLILETEGKWLIEASGAVDSDNITVLQSIPIESSQLVSQTIINYVARTSESVVLNDTTREENFTNDPYIKEHQPKSILCVPLLNQGKLTSIVYLENNLTTGAFTPDRLEVLKILSSSAAISIENAKELCLRKKAEEELLKAEQKYRSIFENALEGIFQTTLDGHYLSANQALAQIYGYDSPQELIATVSSIQNQVYVDSCRRREFITLMQQHGAVSEFESMVCRQDGKIIWISENARTVYDASGVLLYYQGFVEDITSRKLAEAERIKFTNDLFQLNQALSRFVPRQFLQLLDKKSIIDVKLGDQVQQEMSVLFSDIRDFTALSESMTPQENFQFINAYLSRMEPAIIENQGFIDKYIGDAIMALFSGIADDAVKAGIAMLKKLREYNEHRVNSGYAPICIGIGINTGSLMLGTVGGKNRMDSTAISDTVNLASRLEGLTKHYGVSLLISGQTLARLHNPMDYSIRFVEQVKVKGKSKAVAVFEVFDADKLQIKEVKLATKTIFEEGLWLYYQHCFSEAAKRFKEVLSINPKDTVAQIYLKTSKGNFAQ